MGFIYLFLAGRGQTAAITKLPPDVAPWPGNCASRCPGSCKVLGTRLDPGNGNAGHGPGAPAGSVGPREGGQGTAGPWGIGGSRDWGARGHPTPSLGQSGALTFHRTILPLSPELWPQQGHGSTTAPPDIAHARPAKVDALPGRAACTEACSGMGPRHGH